MVRRTRVASGIAPPSISWSTCRASRSPSSTRATSLKHKVENASISLSTWMMGTCLDKHTRAGYLFQRSSVPPRSPLHYQLENGGAVCPDSHQRVTGLALTRDRASPLLSLREIGAALRERNTSEHSDHLTGNVHTQRNNRSLVSSHALEGRSCRLVVYFLETHNESWIPGWVTAKSQVRS